MANILLTQRCVRSCPYCFARKHMSQSAPDDRLSWEDFIYIIDLHEASGERHISLLGGEPTLHPEFVDFVLYAAERKFHVTVFTSGIMTETRLGEAEIFLKGLTPEQLTFICNVNNPLESPESENKRVESFLKKFNALTSLGFNIYKTDFDINFLFSYINRFGLNRNIRFGLAHPVPGRENQFVPGECIRDIGGRFMTFAPLFEKLRVKPGFDCGFLLCAFSEDQLGRLFKLALGDLKFGCGPAIDIGPDMSVWPCFPLSGFHKKSLFEFDRLKDVFHYYDDLHGKVRMETSGVYLECDTCRHRETGLCSGGCLAHILSRLHEEHPVRIPEIYQ